MNTKSGNKFIKYVIDALCVVGPLVVGMISASIAGDQMKSFGELNQPPLSPPAWLFPIVWTVLYLMMGVTLMLIVRAHHEYKVGAICLFIFQLGMNFLWSPVFFVEQDYIKALLILTSMLAITIFLAFIVRPINKLAAQLLIPYIVWMSFAAYLNSAIGILNS
ncbi:MAG: tryptophan-rich sensory protein [Clostridiales bacterium]|nr:tryptophan-rich sensory protein [Candidatus Crickella caballi]